MVQDKAHNSKPAAQAAVGPVARHNVGPGLPSLLAGAPQACSLFSLPARQACTSCWPSFFLSREKRVGLLISLPFHAQGHPLQTDQPTSPVHAAHTLPPTWFLLAYSPTHISLFPRQINWISRQGLSARQLCIIKGCSFLI